MAFEKLEIVVRSGRAGMPASVTLTGHASGRPGFLINLSKEFSEQMSIDAGDRFDLMIGTEDDLGTVRLVRDPDGLIEATLNGRGGAKFYCGHIERFGTEAREKHFCAAEFDADTGAIEITLPPWAMEQDAS
jgi:hypothetical protein